MFVHSRKPPPPNFKHFYWDRINMLPVTPEDKVQSSTLCIRCNLLNKILQKGKRIKKQNKKHQPILIIILKYDRLSLRLLTCQCLPQFTVIWRAWSLTTMQITSTTHHSNILFRMLPSDLFTGNEKGGRAIMVNKKKKAYNPPPKQKTNPPYLNTELQHLPGTQKAWVPLPQSSTRKIKVNPPKRL